MIRCALALPCLLAALACAACGSDEPATKPSVGTSAQDGNPTANLAQDTNAGGAGDAASATQDAEQPDGSGPETDPETAAGGDVASLDAAEVVDCPGQVGCACQLDADCPPSSACVASSNGKVCAKPCLSAEPCGEGQVCLTLPGADTATTDDDKTVCVFKFAHLCDPCTTGATCELGTAKPGVCLGWGKPAGSDGSFCSATCADATQCPIGYSCSDSVTSDGDLVQACRPAGGQCNCGGWAKSQMLSTPCATATALPSGATAVCAGVRLCDQTGLSNCSAAGPGPEKCNGLDDDCNGQIDEGSDCGDGSLCTTDACANGACVNLPNTASCTDGDSCTTADQCAGGSCVGGKALGCDDANPCTTDACNPLVGCSHAGNSGPCEDGDTCTDKDLCADGTCTAGATICTCQNDADCKAKEDGNLCNGNLYCAKAQPPFVCKVNPATIVTCNPKDDTVCAIATCEPKDGGCKPKFQNDGKGCDDGSACTGIDQCKGGSCNGGAIACDDGNSCTADTCDAKAGCSHTATTTKCDDGDVCTLGDACADKACKTTPKVCNDGYACTVDACDKTSGGCKNAPTGDPGCGTATLPFSQAFGCGATGLDNWQKSDWALPSTAVKWGSDSAPALTGIPGGTCTLNINNGKDLGCGSDQGILAAGVESPVLDGSLALATTVYGVKLSSGGNWTDKHSAKVQARIVGGEWVDLGSALVPGAVGLSPVQLSAKGFGGKKWQLRVWFAGPCQPGAIGWFVGDIAVFEDKCALNNGGCLATQTCTSDGTGAATCTTCKPGYQTKDGQCIDTDECAIAGSCSVHANCSNSPGSYTCTCKSGYAGDGKACTDIDECATGKSDCGTGATCTNTLGGFACKCGPNTVSDGKNCLKKGFDAKTPAANCLEILTLYPGTPDGTYWLDFDGAGPLGSGQYVCDMKNGGWTLLIFDDFEDGASKGWSGGGKVQGCGDYSKIWGGSDVFGKGASTVKTVNAPAHTQAKLFLHYIRGDTWDGESGTVAVNGNGVFSQKGWGSLLGNKCGDWPGEDRWDVNWIGGHTAGTATVTASSTLDEGAGNEWFGIDNIVFWVK